MKNLITLLLITISISANAQLLKRLKAKVSEKINSAIERKVEDKIDNKIDKEVDKLFDKNQTSETTSEEADSEKNTRSINLEKFGIKKTPTVNKTYTFVTQIDFEIKENGKDINNMTMWKADDDYSAIKMIMDEGTLIFITDKDTSISLLENNGTKTQVPINNNAFQKKYKQDYLENFQDESNFERTGKTKTILGYKCSEYIVKTKDGTANCWITEELKNTQSLFTNSLGTVLESVYDDGDKEYITKVKNISHKTIKIDTSEYKNIMSMF